MDRHFKKVYVDDGTFTPNRTNDNEVEIAAEYVYLTIPMEYVCLYNKLLVYLADFGEAAIKDCQAACKGQNLYVIQCWNMFQSALACHALGLFDKADLFIKYIEAQLENIYKNSDKEMYECGATLMPISKDGRLKARVSCDSAGQTRFFTDPETGRLYEEYITQEEYGRVYVEGDHLKFDENGTDS